MFTTTGLGIVLGVVLVVGVVVFLVWKLVKGGKNASVMLGIAAIGPIVNAIKDMIPNKEGIDANEIVAAVGKMADGATKAISDPANVTFDDCKDDITAIVKEELVILGVKDVSDAMISNTISALFVLIKNYPAIVEQIKKVQAQVSAKKG